MNSHRAILILGPTGSGKTPLGDLIEQRGLWGGRCAHFDFGRILRRVADGVGSCRALGRQQIKHIRDVLDRGALLEDESFGIAEAVLADFVASRAMGPDDRIVLNGLPRHIGQAEALAGWVEVGLVVQLCCSPSAVMARIARNTGGDRDRRDDDSPEAVLRRVQVFEERTVPLVDYYRRRGVPVVMVAVATDTTPEEVRQVLEEHNRPAPSPHR